MKRSHDTTLDFFVVGAGSAGVRAARIAASLGAKVGVCESGPLGGTCVNVGCVPKKLMVYGAHFAAEWEQAAGYGWSSPPPSHDWAKLIENKDREILRLNGIYEKLLLGKGVTIWKGRGTLLGPNEVEIATPDGDTVTVRAKHILVAVGGRPMAPEIPGAEHVMVSDDVFRLSKMPRRILIAGGGYIAVEFAGIFKGYGAEVTQIHRGPLFLRGFDRDVRTHLDAEMRAHGIDLRFHRSLARVDRLADGALSAVLDDGTKLEVDAVLAAIGRVPNTTGIGLEDVGVKLDDRGAIRVDERFRTSVKSIYAVGDVIDRIQLTPVALAEGMLVAQSLFGKRTGTQDYDYVPSAVFSTPPIGTVGLTEEEARAELGKVEVYKSTFTPMKETMTGFGSKSFMKLVVECATRRVVGVHVVAPDAGEIVQGFAVALKCGATKEQFDSTIGIHPTAAEELVTLREPVSVPDHEVEIELKEPPRARRIIHHRWEDGEGT